MKHIVIVILFSITLSLSACTSAYKVLSFTQSNSIVVSVATQQAVMRFIEAGHDADEQVVRAGKVVKVITELQNYLSGNPLASSETLFIVLKAHVNLERLTPSDQILVQSIFSVIETTIERRQDTGLIEEDAMIKLRVLLRTVATTAQYFL